MHAAAFNRAEKEYGVPPAVIAAFWGLESSFGAELGKLHTLPSLVSLAYDCRRSEMFQKETIAALKIIDRGDLTRKRDDRFVGRRTRPDAIFADALFQLRGRLRRRRPSRHAAQRARRDRLDRELHRQWIEMAARRTLAAGSAGAAEFAVGPGRSHHQASALEMDAVRRHLSRRQGAADRTICRRRCCCRWAGRDRRSWPMRISPPIPSGTTR